MGAQWNPGDTVNSGSVHYLVPPEDRTKLWSPVKLHHEPTTHRMRWVSTGDDYVLVVAPLHGRGNRNGRGQGVRLLAYQMPPEPRRRWPLTVLEDSMHFTHNLDVVQHDPKTPAEEIFYIGREGAMLISHSADRWSKTKLEGVQGGSEIRRGHHQPREPFLVTVEPFHGTKLVYYRLDRPGGTKVTQRKVLDDTLAAGHAVACADLFGNGQTQVVAGWRSRNRDGHVGVKLYWPTDQQGWTSTWVDHNGMACEDLRIADLDDDGRLDIVAAGRSTHNLKVYWNKPRKTGNHR